MWNIATKPGKNYKKYFDFNAGANGRGKATDIIFSYCRIILSTNYKIAYIYLNFRLIIKINFKAEAAYILWFGTHKEYDRIDVKNIVFKH